MSLFQASQHRATISSYDLNIRTHLQLSRRIRDLALFNLAIDSKLRGCDVVSLKIDDVAPHGYTLDRATIRQRKTDRPVKFKITQQTRQAIDEYMNPDVAHRSERANHARTLEGVVSFLEAVQDGLAPGPVFVLGDDALVRQVVQYVEALLDRLLVRLSANLDS